MKPKEKIVLSKIDDPGEDGIDYSTDPFANDPFIVKKNEEARRFLVRAIWPKELLERKK